MIRMWVLSLRYPRNGEAVGTSELSSPMVSGYKTGNYNSRSDLPQITPKLEVLGKQKNNHCDQCWAYCMYSHLIPIQLSTFILQITVAKNKDHTKYMGFPVNIYDKNPFLPKLNSPLSLSTH